MQRNDGYQENGTVGFGEVLGATFGGHGKKFSPDIVLTVSDLGRHTWYSVLFIQGSFLRPSPSAFHPHLQAVRLSPKLPGECAALSPDLSQIRYSIDSLSSAPRTPASQVRL